MRCQYGSNRISESHNNSLSQLQVGLIALTNLCGYVKIAAVTSFKRNMTRFLKPIQFESNIELVSICSQLLNKENSFRNRIC